MRLHGCPPASHFDANLHLVHVNDLAAEAPVLIPVLSLDPGFEPKVRRRLQTIAGKCDQPITASHCHVRIGEAYDQICREARKLKADLIVISTHGYTGLKHVLIGSTAERVVRHVPCPVLVVRKQEREFVGPGKTPVGARVLNIKKIVVPVDFSEHSHAAVRYAVGWAKRFGAGLTPAPAASRISRSTLSQWLPSPSAAWLEKRSH